MCIKAFVIEGLPMNQFFKGFRFLPDYIDAQAGLGVEAKCCFSIAQIASYLSVEVISCKASSSENISRRLRKIFSFMFLSKCNSRLLSILSTFLRKMGTCFIFCRKKDQM